MRVDRKFIGQTSDPVTVRVDAGQLKLFARAVGEMNPIYFDEAAAREAGHHALPAPPTFAFSLNLARPRPFGYLEDVGISVDEALHAEQKFEYFNPIYAGDLITLQDTVIDIYDKKDGALEFVVWETSATNQCGLNVVKMWHTAVVRN